ncbi:Ras family [Pelomyxa schiedti]|nr:Ras family [Pelomyxa schiedti]
MAKATPIKALLIGDTYVGKSCLLHAFLNGEMPEEYEQTTDKTYSATVEVDGVSHTMSLRDTSGMDEYDEYRPVAYLGVDVGLVCFSVMNPTSFKNAKSKWIPELQHHCPAAKIILIGTHIDRVDNASALRILKKRNLVPVSKSEGDALALEIGAVAYIQCSSSSKLGLSSIFQAAVKSMLT